MAPGTATTPERALYVRIEPGLGGRFLDIYDAKTDAGFEAGRVTVWEPGRRLGLTWTQIGWPDGVATDIEVSFEPLGEGTRVTIEQTGFERDGSSRGEPLMVGTFANPQQNGSMSIFASREAAEEFVSEDPFRLNGVIRGWRVLDCRRARGELTRSAAPGRTTVLVKRRVSPRRRFPRHRQAAAMATCLTAAM